ncbi:universal stress protein [Pseudarthrobacter sp. J1763]|uniref:universal stress protein n=1 Tax=Pseudarthrobacter sp. J1763 TaxID=3420445 RepID=UPI003D2A1971
MSSKQPIVVGVDQSASSKVALEWAARRAEALQLPLVLMHVIDELAGPTDLHNERQKSIALLENDADRVREFAPLTEVQVHITQGDPAGKLVEASHDAEMLVVGTDRAADIHGEGFGAVNSQLTVLALCPLAIIPQHTPSEATRIVVGIDGSPNSLVAAHFAAGEALRGGGELTMIYAASTSTGLVGSSSDESDAQTAGQDVIDSTITELQARFGVALNVQGHVIFGEDPAQALKDSARHATLLVVGSRGGDVVHHLRHGLTTHSLLQGLVCPLVLTRPAN